MKTKIVFAFLWLNLVACDKDEVTLKNINSVSQLADIKVAYGTAFDMIEFLKTVNVTYSDNSSEEISMIFSKGLYNETVAGTYLLEGTLTPATGTTNQQSLKASINVIVSPLKLKTVSQDGSLLYEYQYDELNRLNLFKSNSNNSEYAYTYSSDHTVVQRVRNVGGNAYAEKYFYKSDKTLDRIEFYYGDNILDHTLTYSYKNAKIFRYDNSDKSVNGLTYRIFTYDAQNNITNVAFDFGNPWSYTYYTDKKVATPFVLDFSDPQNQTIHPIATFNFVELSSYTSTYTYNEWNYPTEELRTFPGDGNKQSTYTYTYE